MTRTYEVMFILRPDLADEQSDQLVATLESAATGAGATLRRTDRLGRRRLAYRVRGFREGNYVLFDLESGAEPIHELQRRLRVSEPVIKFLAVRTDEIDARMEKDKRRREARLKRRPAAAAPAPSVEAEMAAAAPEGEAAPA